MSEIFSDEDTSKLFQLVHMFQRSALLHMGFIPDQNGNKYYESKNGRRWVIYNGEVDSTKIPNEWFSWIHFTKNKIEKVQDQKKFSWQKSHKPNLTGTDKAYHPKKSENENKKYKSWKE